MPKFTPNALNAIFAEGRDEAAVYEAVLREAYLRVLADAERDAADRLLVLTAAADWTIPDIDELYDKLKVIAAAQGTTEGVRLAVVETMMEGLLAKYGISFDVKNPLVEHLLLEQGQHIVGIVDSHREQIMTLLRDEWEKGTSARDAAAVVKSTGIERTLSQAETIARTELVSAMNGGSLAAVHLTGAMEYKQWLTSAGAPNPRHHTPDYPELEHQVKPLAAPFHVGGYLAQYPGDPSLPAGENINCRCTVIYVDSPEGILASAPPQEDAMSVNLTTASMTAGPTLPPAVVGREKPAQEAVTAAAPPADWTSPALAQYDTLTRDARMIAKDSLTWDAPMPFMMMDGGEHGGPAPVTQNAGAITSIIAEGNNLVAEGTFDEGPAGDRARELAATGRYGVSVDLAVQEFEVLINSAGFDPFWDLPLPTQAPPGVKEAASAAEVEASRKQDDFYDPENLPEGWYKLPINLEDEVMRVTRGEIMGATLVPFAAFKDARIQVTGLAADGSPTRLSIVSEIRLVSARIPAIGEQAWIDNRGRAVTASGAGLAPVLPPCEWFQTPTLDEPTPLTVTPEGEVYGHIAAWGTCHTGFAGQCVQPPSGDGRYSLFHLGEIETAEGDRVLVGHVTMATGHADLGLANGDAIAHYDNTGTVVADVRIGNDAHGIWAHGALRPHITAEEAREFMASKPSGDWRPIDGRLELVAVLAVNVPGFPVTRARVASGHVLALVAAGQVAPAPAVAWSEHRVEALHAAAQGRDALHRLARGE